MGSAHSQESRYQSIDDTIVQLFISEASVLIAGVARFNRDAHRCWRVGDSAIYWVRTFRRKVVHVEQENGNRDLSSGRYWRRSSRGVSERRL